jgi:hypothetical protein
LGDKSVEDAFREPPLRAAARALARGLKGDLLAPGVDGEGRPEGVFDPLRSDAAESVLGPIGTVKFWRFWLEEDGFSAGGGCGINSGSGGASAGGIGRPRAAATS